MHWCNKPDWIVRGDNVLARSRNRERSWYSTEDKEGVGWCLKALITKVNKIQCVSSSCAEWLEHHILPQTCTNSTLQLCKSQKGKDSYIHIMYVSTTVDSSDCSSFLLACADVANIEIYFHMFHSF